MFHEMILYNDNPIIPWLDDVTGSSEQLREQGKKCEVHIHLMQSDYVTAI